MRVAREFWLSAGRVSARFDFRAVLPYPERRREAGIDSDQLRIVGRSRSQRMRPPC